MMRRIMLMVTVALVMAAMMLATAMPAFAGGAGGTCRQSTSTTFECSGGTGVGGGSGGFGGKVAVNLATGDFTISGGGGGQGGGAGGRCTGNFFGGEECKGGLGL
jgi:hypothetical protein